MLKMHSQFPNYPRVIFPESSSRKKYLPQVLSLPICKLGIGFCTVFFNLRENSRNWPIARPSLVKLMHISSYFVHDVLEASQRVYTQGTRNIYQVFINGLFITVGQWLCRQGCGRKNHKNLHHITMEIMTTKRISL